MCDDTCNICCEGKVEKKLPNCNHRLCGNCYSEIENRPAAQWNSQTGKMTHLEARCPFCRSMVYTAKKPSDILKIAPHLKATDLKINWGIPDEDSSDNNNFTEQIGAILLQLQYHLQRTYQQQSRRSTRQPYRQMTRRIRRVRTDGPPNAMVYIISSDSDAETETGEPGRAPSSELHDSNEPFEQVLSRHTEYQQRLWTPEHTPGQLAAQVESSTPARAPPSEQVIDLSRDEPWCLDNDSLYILNLLEAAHVTANNALRAGEITEEQVDEYAESLFNESISN